MVGSSYLCRCQHGICLLLLCCHSTSALVCCRIEAPIFKWLQQHLSPPSDRLGVQHLRWLQETECGIFGPQQWLLLQCCKHLHICMHDVQTVGWGEVFRKPLQVLLAAQWQGYVLNCWARSKVSNFIFRTYLAGMPHCLTWRSFPNSYHSRFSRNC